MPENGVSKPAPQPEESEMQRAQPILCAENCGFYGRAEQRNMCSKCFTDAIKREKSSPPAAAAVEAKLKNKNTDEEVVPAFASSAEAASTQQQQDDGKDVVDAKKKVKKNRCDSCRRKLRLAQQFSCRCDLNFCSSHRDPDTHNCKFDFKSLHQEQLSKANPIVVASKVNKI